MTSHMAPEVLSGSRATQAADVFAWGALIIFAASGVEPFRGANIGEVAHRTAFVEPDLSLLPARLRPLVAAAVAKDPQRRPSSLELLTGLVGDSPGSAGPRRMLMETGARRAEPVAKTPAPVEPSLGGAQRPPSPRCRTSAGRPVGRGGTDAPACRTR
ncbi:hypothetical protein [Streptomyces sp. NPDC006274]|uniref:hypothetical protein n=1 Tax=unclassified Streptomyces TaxID=2593676 RepID=UPI0033B07186